MNLRVVVTGGKASSQKAILSHLGRLSADIETSLRTVDETIALVKDGGADLVFLGVEGLDSVALEHVEGFRRGSSHVEIIVVAEKPSLEFAMEAIRRGASDCLAVPVRREQVALAVDRVRRVRGLLDENRRLREQIQEREKTDGLVGTSAVIVRVLKMVEEAAAEEGGVLIFGEPGTERTYVAKLIHTQGRRSALPFVAVDCATASRETLETGALAEAGGGTIHLDNIEELPGSMQETVVAATMAPQGLRVIGGTTKNLLDLAGRGLFRRGMLEAVSAATITIPPLRERREDLPLLVGDLLGRLSPPDRVIHASPEAMDAMREYSWPGNLEELERVIQRAIDLGSGTLIARGDLPPSVIQGGESGTSDTGTVATKSLKELESQVIHDLLVAQKGDTDAVSKLLKIDRSTLYRKIKRYGINLDRLKPE